MSEYYAAHSYKGDSNFFGQMNIVIQCKCGKRYTGTNKNENRATASAARQLQNHIRKANKKNK